MKSRLILVFCLIFPFQSLWAKPSFSINHLSSENQLLFSCRSTEPGWSSFETLLSTRLESSAEYSLKTLTFFPERSRYFWPAGELEIQNRFGLFRFNLLNGSSRTLAFYPSFSSGAILPLGRILPVASSPDGRWVAVQEPSGEVYGALVLYNTHTGKRHEITRRVKMSYQDSPIQWSPDSRYLLYSRSDRLYSLSIRQLEEGRLPDESHRDFGGGNLSSVSWAGPDELYHLNGKLLRMLRPPTLFSRSFYSAPLAEGENSARLPVSFDSEFDEFWPSPGGDEVLIFKDNRYLFVFDALTPVEKQFTSSFKAEGSKAEASRLPFLSLPPGSTVLQIWWKNSGEILLLTGSRLTDGGQWNSSQDSRLYRLERQNKYNAQFVPIDNLEGIRRFAPSPDRRRMATIDKDGVRLWNSESLEELSFWAHNEPRDLFWIDGSRLLVAGAYRSEVLNLETGSWSLVTLSQVEKYEFDLNPARADDSFVAISDGRYYRYDEEQWKPAVNGSAVSLGSGKRESPEFRVYLEKLESSAYENFVMVRNSEGLGNRSLFPVPQFDFAIGEAELQRPTGGLAGGRQAVERSFESRSIDSRVFSHGSPKSGREISLVFDASDGDEGLTEVLKVLGDYNIRSTFFVGGDFIRRQPESARILAASGHEVGSLFYTDMDMTDWRYRIDREFVMQGLARNEDEYYRVTGSEVSTLWHAPWYAVSPSILDGGEAMGYVNVGRSIDTLDWVSLDSVFKPRNEIENLYKPSAQLIEDVLKSVQPGSIIPVTIGRKGHRENYLFSDLDLMVNGLLEKGYDIVPVSVLREHSR